MTMFRVLNYSGATPREISEVVNNLMNGKSNNTGMCGIHCVEGINPLQTINGIQIHPQDASFGNVLIPMSAIEKIGYFNEAYDPYGMQDSDYAYRLKMTGHINYYLHDLRSEHIGHDVGQDTPYRKMKDEG